MKHLETILAGVMAASLVAPMAPVMAAVQKEETTEIAISIQSAQDFINTFAKHTVTTVHEDGTETSDSVFYTEVNRDNYSTILSGKAIYDTLSDEMKAEIDKTILENTGIEYGAMVESANTINAEVIAEQEAAAQAEQEAAEQIGPSADEAPEEEEVESSEEENQEEEQEDTNSDQEEEQEDSQEEVQGPMLMSLMSVSIGPVASSESEEEIAEPVALSEEEIYALEEQEALFTVENDLAPQEEVQEAVGSGDIIVEYIDVSEDENTNIYSITSVAQLAESGATDEEIEEKFVESYCSLNNSIFTNVTSGNYMQIISGYEDWQGLTLAQKTGVNKILTSNGSSTYTKLYNAAQNLNGNSNTSYGGVITSVSTNAVGYGIMSGISAAVIAFLFRKRKI